MDDKKFPDRDTKPVAPLGTQADLVLPLKESTYNGVLLKGRYLIEGELGRGGIGVVYLARDTQLLKRRVVIKVLLQGEEGSVHTEWFKKKFDQEIEALVRLDHPSIVGVLDAGDMPDGKPFFVMQYVEGATLRSLMTGEPIDFPRVASLVRQIGGALSAAHDKGIIHRDLKPENIMVQTMRDGEEIIKLIDFGIATVKDSQYATETERTKIAGALPYMAPEQLRGQPETASDIWALGVIAYELLTGKMPFSTFIPVQLHDEQRRGVQTRPSQLLATIPQAAEAVILKALSFDPHSRHSRAKEFGDELASALTVPLDSPSIKPGEATTSLTPEIAHVLFMDLVGYSKLPMDQQPALQRELREIVRQTAEYRRVQQSNEIISLPTGDGMALVFFRDPVAPVQCAVDIARAIKDHPAIKLRIGVHSGPVYRVADINTNRNVAGGGINLAQRVMDCGDTGHILVSNIVAETLSAFGQWSNWLHDLGKHEVKHGAIIHVFNLYNEDIGNPQIPEKMRVVAETTVSTKDLPVEEPILPPKASSGLLKPVVAAVVVLALIAAFFIGQSLLKTRQPVTDGKPASPAAAASQRNLNYSIRVRLNPKKNPNQSPIQLAGEIIFSAGDELCFNINSPQDGYLYIVNEGPAPKNGLPRYNVLFPNSEIAGVDAPSLQANKLLFIPSQNPPWFPVDNEQGTEKLWLVWSDRAVKEMETVRKWLNEKDGGEIKDPGEAAMLQQFLATHYSASPAIAEKGEFQTSLRGGRDGLMIFPVKLEHR